MKPEKFKDRLKSVLDGYVVDDIETPDGLRIGDLTELEDVQALIFKASAIILETRQELDDSWADSTKGIIADSYWLADTRDILRQWDKTHKALVLKAKSLKDRSALRRKSILIRLFLEKCPQNIIADVFDAYNKLGIGPLNEADKEAA